MPVDRQAGTEHVILNIDHYVIAFAHLDGRPRQLSIHKLSGALDTVAGHALAIAAEVIRRTGSAQVAGPSRTF